MDRVERQVGQKRLGPMGFDEGGRSRAKRSGKDCPGGPSGSLGFWNGAKKPPGGLPAWKPPTLISNPWSSGYEPGPPKCHLPAKNVR